MALQLALCDIRQVIYFFYASDFVYVKWKIVTLSSPISFAKNNKLLFLHSTLVLLKDILLYIYATSGNGPTQANSIFKSLGVNSYYLLCIFFLVTGTVLNFIPSQTTQR